MMRPARAPLSSTWGSTVFASCSKSSCSSLDLRSHIQNRMHRVECVFDHLFAPMYADAWIFAPDSVGITIGILACQALILSKTHCPHQFVDGFEYLS